MKKIISFSLYKGINCLTNPNVYNYGTLCNIELAKIIYPEWICRIYYGESISEDIIEKISKYDNVELCPMDENENYHYAMWRFLAIDDEDVEIMISRDADSRLSYREKKLVDIFEKSNFLLHSIRDNRLHSHIMAGMWGLKKNSRINMSELCLKFKKADPRQTNHYGADEDFLKTKIGPIFEDSILTHCSHDLKNFPFGPDENGYFIGQTFIYGDNNGLPLNHVFF
jgi:hypothetical protein